MARRRLPHFPHPCQPFAQGVAGISLRLSDSSRIVIRRSPQMAAAVTHFEIYGEEPAKLAEFYRTLFGWEVEKPPGTDYWRIRTDPNNGSRFDGGLTYRPLPGLLTWVHYVSVQSLDAAIDQVERLGGKVLRAKTALPRTGPSWTCRSRSRSASSSSRPTTRAFPLPEPE
jgi:predicted enzyme related to lactoylglutathione lyase